MEVLDTIAVCVDCYMAVANGDLPDNSQRAQEVLAAVKELGPHAVPGYELGFSWYPCACCLSHLGGDRHEVIILG